MQVGEELLAFAEPVVLFGDGLLDLHYKARHLEDFLGAPHDPRSERRVLLVGEARALTGPGLHHDLMTVMHKLRDAVGLHRDAALHVLDLLRHPYHRRHKCSLPHNTFS